MKIEKFQKEVETLDKFFTIYCKKRHHTQHYVDVELYYNDVRVSKELFLCSDCQRLINYSFDRLLECPHEVKPKCRECSNPCYEKSEWKKLASIMRYSSIHIGIDRVKNFFK
jgi:predicted amidophosphoribosyltransferase